jgi:Holliday junction resolvasome RuvABC endonuclease subunit
MTRILGIDPGINGAFAVLETSDRRLVIHDMPDTTAGLIALVDSLPSLDFCMIEQPFYPKIIGMRNAARIAVAYGKVVALIANRGIPLDEVTPSKWKAALNLNSIKTASREMASLVFPASAEQWSRVKDDGRAEAALIAWYAVRLAK